ncbi:dTDP-4-dehydrorhamnose reductase [Gilvimarinus sp. SDUM040013]|uniref:dTDP-4-dehydrorhamnose reductase n=1 Tax=Gilvimarinus gilvus TaxID=3058038 RepID=A0ABU4RY99_9GAMM|nr:dTDP-4-dehydrorhamnose reductase [Gilvimarinus sp. SDUM040013]MDO3385233.1 dTDP-4-dehydrorhamnose reductase [Gilvimarinus sp. SDUM040013]MDX6849216.1 dTDP-4-dehydrorhamnose reductase [Gilvimarinus sp. SDUM040013]
MINTSRILVLGSTGQLGSEIRYLCSDITDNEWIFADRSALDLTDSSAIDAYVAKHAPQVIINCAAYTAVDNAEREADLANQINHLAVRALALAAKKMGASLIHISTDYVFDGRHHRPYFPDDLTEPTGEYGKSKLAGEQAIVATNVRGIIIRTSWVYSCFGGNFVKTMLRLGAEKPSLNVVADQVGSPTWARDLAQAIIHITAHSEIANKTGEIYHYSNTGACSWFDFAEHIMNHRQLSCKLSPIRTEEYPTPAQRPHYSVLDCRKICDDFDISIPYWNHSLAKSLVEF